LANSTAAAGQIDTYEYM